MKQFILRTTAALFVLCGFLTFVETCSANVFFPNLPVQSADNVNPVMRNPAAFHPLTPTQMKTGYTRQEIRAMPMVSRPSRPGHFIGNTVRRRAGVGY